MKERREISIETQLKQSLSAEQAWHYHIVPKATENGTLIFYADRNKKDQNLSAELEMLFGKSILLILMICPLSSALFLK